MTRRQNKIRRLRTLVRQCRVAEIMTPEAIDVTIRRLLAVCEAELECHPPKRHGLCSVCHHYGDDCTAHAVAFAVANVQTALGGGPA